MYCIKCGKEIKDGSKFCEFCGADVSSEKANTVMTTSTVETANQSVTTETPMQTVSNNKTTNGFAIAGLVCSFIIPLLGWIFGGIGLSKSKTTNSGKGLSIAAIVVASVMFIVNLIIMN